MHEYLKEFPNREDELRYVLTAIAPETSDSEFTWKDYQARVNNELVAILGNFVNRVITLMNKYYEGKIPGSGKIDILDKNVHDAIGKAYDSIVNNVENYKFRNGLSEVMDLARFGNKYLTDNEPWKIIGTDPTKAQHVLVDSLMIIAHLGACIQPFLPFTSKKIFSLLKMEKSEYKWNDEIDFQLEKLAVSKNAIAAIKKDLNAAKESISYDDFIKMDIRVGEIKDAEKVPKADKLLKLTVDTGIDVRTVVSGIAEFYKPEDIIGKKVSILINLAPRKIKGIESQGMILMAEDSSGKLNFVNTVDEGFENGSEIR